MSASDFPFQGGQRMRLFGRSGKQAPAQCFAGVERDEAFDLLRYLDLCPFEGDRLLVDWQVVETSAVDRRERFQLVERAFVLEHARIALERVWRIEQSGAAAGTFLRMARVRRTVGAEEDVRPTRNRCAPHSQPMLLTLGDREAVSVRAQ